MGKSISFLRFADDASIDVARIAGKIAGGAFTGITLDRVAPPPAGLPYKPASDASIGQSRPEYDLIVSLDGDDGLVRDVDWQALIGGAIATVHSYAVEAHTKFDRGARRKPGISPGRKLFGRLMFHADMPDSAARRSWTLHAPLAEKVHVGASRYVQNWVLEALSPNSPPTRGMPEMSFPSDDDLIRRFFDSDRGREEILQDTAHFVASGPRFYTIEHVVRIAAD